MSGMSDVRLTLYQQELLEIPGARVAPPRTGRAAGNSSGAACVPASSCWS